MDALGLQLLSQNDGLSMQLVRRGRERDGIGRVEEDFSLHQ